MHSKVEDNRVANEVAEGIDFDFGRRQMTVLLGARFKEQPRLFGGLQQMMLEESKVRREQGESAPQQPMLLGKGHQSRTSGHRVSP